MKKVAKKVVKKKVLKKIVKKVVKKWPPKKPLNDHDADDMKKAKKKSLTKKKK